MTLNLGRQEPQLTKSNSTMRKDTRRSGEARRERGVLGGEEQNIKEEVRKEEEEQ